MIKESAIIAVILVAAIPLTGFLIDLVVMGIIRFLCGLISKSGGLYLFVANRLTFAGVMWHELSHALFAFISGAKVEKISLYHKEGDHLGYVRYRTRGPWALQCVQHSLSSCAPVVMGLVAIAVIYTAFTSFELPIWGSVLLIYLFISILVHMDMSTQDLKLYVRGVPLFWVIFFVLALVTLSNDPDLIQRMFSSLRPGA